MTHGTPSCTGGIPVRQDDLFLPSYCNLLTWNISGILSGFPGGLKERKAIDQWDRDPTKILKDAVKGMLPKNKTQVYRMEKLKVFPERDHPFTDFDLVRNIDFMVGSCHDMHSEPFSLIQNYLLRV
jgi:hypothetical protein